MEARNRRVGLNRTNGNMRKLWTKNKGAAWPYVLTEEYAIRISQPWAATGGKTLEFRSYGLTWGKLRDGILTLKCGYAIDGATCAPDFEEVIMPAFVHDLLCQFCNDPISPFTRKDADDLFLLEMKKARFRYRWIYYAGVRLGSLWNRKPPFDTSIVVV